MKENKMEHVLLIQEEIDQNKRADEAWEAYQKEIGRHSDQLHLLHRGTVGLYTCDGDRVAEFLVQQKEKLMDIWEENTEFIKFMLRIKNEKIEEQLKRLKE